MEPPARTILHADMDAFYAAVEQRDHPELRGKPVFVSGNSPRSVVLTASYEARPFGVHSAMPYVEAKRLCPNGICVPPRMSVYAVEAKRIRAVFDEFTPMVEPLSLDEAFLDVTASLRLFGGALEIGRRLRARVHEVTDLAVSVGIGPTKTIAKIASGFCKPDGLLEVAADGAADFLRPLEAGALWGVGPKMRATLERLGLHTVGAIADADPEFLERRLGSMGPALWRMAQGLDGRDVDPDRQRKSYGEEQTFATDLRDGPQIRRTIAMQAEDVARRLRHERRRGRTITLKMKLTQKLGGGKYPLLTRRTTLAEPTDDGKTIRDTALALWDAACRGIAIRLIGVAVSGVEDAATQLGLFEAKPQRNSALNQALDSLVARFGEDAVQRGAVRAPTVQSRREKEPNKRR